jgi:Flp pilus assembly protein TadD
MSQISERGEGPATVSDISLVEQGRTAAESGEYEQALTHFQKASALAHDAKDRAGEANALGGLGVAYQKLGRFGEAQEAYEAALSIYQNIHEPEARAMALGNFGSLKARQGKGAEAETLLSEAAESFAALGLRAYQADTLRLLAKVQLRRAGWLDAIFTYERALDCMDRLTLRQRVLRALSQFAYRILGARR